MKIIRTICLGMLMLGFMQSGFAQEKALPADQQRKFDYFFIEALRMKAAGEYDKALKNYSQCLSIDPESAVCKYEMATLLDGQADKKELVHNLYLSATILNPNNQWYLERLGQFYLQNKMNDPAIEVYKKLSLDHPTDLSYAIMLTELLKQQNRIPEAIAALDKLQEVIGPKPDLILEKQQLQMEAKDYSGAIKDIDVLIAKYPNDYRYPLIKGDIYMQDKQYKNAYKSYTDIQKKFPDNGNIHLSLAGYYETQNQDGKTQDEVLKAFASNDVDVNRKLTIMAQYLQAEQANQDSTVVHKNEFQFDTNKMLEVLLAANPNEPAVHRFIGIKALNKSVLEATKGDSIQTKNDREEAMENFEQVIKADPSDKSIWGQLLMMKFQDEKWSELEILSNKAIAAIPLNPTYYFFNGLANFQLNNFDKAASAYETGVSYCFKDDDAIKIQLLSSLGDTYYKLGNPDKAFSTYDEVLKMDEHNLLVLNNYAYYLSVTGRDLGKAEAMSRTTIDLEPLNGTYLDTYAWILYKAEKYEDALTYIEKAVQVGSDIQTSPEVWEHYGDILHKLGQDDAAKDQWRKAIDKGGDAKQLNKKISDAK